VETAPNVAHVWGLWNQNINIQRLITPGYILSWAASFQGSDEIQFMSIQDGRREMLEEVRGLMDEADAVVHYNGTRFDIPTLNKEFVLFDMPPPAPYHQIDLYRTVRAQFRFPSNKLEYVAGALGLGGKIKHRGYQLWIDCMEGKEDAWLEMEEYNIQDVELLEQLYDRILPWIKNHPNVGLYNEDGSSLVCPHCGGNRYQQRGSYYTQTRKYKRFQCQSDGCYKWFRSVISGDDKAITKFVKVD
jgi:hypothetical protein